MFDPTSPEIPIFIRQNIHNTIDADENAFVAA
jgi:hypothetical protein